MKDFKITFPLRWGSEDHKVYIFDSNNIAIVQVESLKKNLGERHPFEKIVGDYKQLPKRKEESTYFTYQEDIYDANYGERIGTFLVEDEYTIEYILNAINL